MTYFLDLRADSVGGILAAEVTARRDRERIDSAELDRESRGRDVVLVAHGFNVDREAGIERLSWWEERLQLGQALFVGILWPGDSVWAPVVDYPLEGNEAIASGRRLGDYLSRHLPDAVSLSLAAHSLGARVALETIRRLVRPGPARRPVRCLILMAGAIDDDCLSKEYRDSAEKVESISILASKGDRVLELAFPVGNLLGGIITRGEPYWHAALGREGPGAPFPDGLRAGWQIPDAWKYGHHDYLGDAPPLGPLIARPVDIPIQSAPPPTTPLDWQPAWSAAFAATRLL
jgi:hypothetical protein